MVISQADQKLHLLELPLEIRLHIYSLVFQTTPICFISRKPDFWMPVHQVFWSKGGPRHRLYARNKILFKICKQIQSEAASVLVSESPLDLYSWHIDPEELGGLINKTKHIICPSFKVEEYFEPRIKEVKFDSLKKVTIVDGSHFFNDLTDDIQRRANVSAGYRRYSYKLGPAVATLRKRGVNTIEIRNAKPKFRRREIYVQFRSTGIEITVYGIPCHWEKRARAQILTELSLDPALTSFEFRNTGWSRWGRLQTRPRDPFIDWFANLLDREARPLNQMLEWCELPARVSTYNDKRWLLNYPLNGRVLVELHNRVMRKGYARYHFTKNLPRLVGTWKKANTTADLIAMLSQKGHLYPDFWIPDLIRILRETSGVPSLESITKERFISLRGLKTLLCELTGERKALDEVVEICEFLAVAQLDRDQQVSPCIENSALPDIGEDRAFHGWIYNPDRSSKLV